MSLDHPIVREYGISPSFYVLPTIDLKFVEAYHDDPGD